LQLATSVNARSYGRVMSGEFSIEVNLRPGVLPEQVMSVVDEVLAEYIDTGPDQQLLDNAKLAINMYMLGTLESGSSIGRILAEGYLYSDDPLFINNELEWLNAATSAEIRQVAERWLTRSYYQLTVKPFPEYVSGEATADRSSIPEVTAGSEINFPDIETATLDNGIKIVVARRGVIPLVDVSIAIDTGATAAPAEAPGIAAFVFGMLDKGTDKYDANELAAAKDKIGMGARARDGLERSSFSYRILRSKLDESLDLAAEILRNPTFPDEELEKLKARIYAWLSNLENAPGQAAKSLFSRAIYGTDNPLGGVWTPELVGGVDRVMIESFHANEVTPDNMTVFMIGNIGIDEAKKAVNKAFGRWKARSNSARKPVGSAQTAQARVILVDHSGAESSTIVAGHAIAPFDPETATELSIMNGPFGGNFESRLNMNLREDKGWSYGYRSGIDQNTSGDQALIASGQVQTDKTAESMQEILKEFLAVVGDRPLTATEIERIKLNRTRSLPGSFATNEGFLRSIILSDSYGLPYDHAEGMPDRVAAVTTDGANARAKVTIEPSNLTWVVVGDLDRIEESVRALEYGEVEVWDAFGNRLR
jgi:zinc protease